MNTILAIAFGVIFVAVLLVWGLLKMRDRGTHADDSQWPHGKDLKGGGGK